MANLKVLLILVVGFCCVALTLSASMNYEEPPMEAVSDDDKEGSAAEMQAEEDGSGDKDEDGSGEGDDDGNGDEIDNESGDDEDMKEKEPSDDTEIDDDTEEEDKDKNSEKENSASDEEESDDDKKDAEEEKEMDEADKEMSVVEQSASCPTMKPKDCELTETLKIVVSVLKLLKEEVSELKESVKKSCDAKSEDDESDESSEGKIIKNIFVKCTFFFTFVHTHPYIYIYIYNRLSLYKSIHITHPYYIRSQKEMLILPENGFVRQIQAFSH